jgi:hypothetical protein
VEGVAGCYHFAQLTKPWSKPVSSVRTGVTEVRARELSLSNITPTFPTTLRRMGEFCGRDSDCGLPV